MNPPDTPDPLDALARRTADDPFSLASVLADYQRRHDLTDDALAALLGCAPAVLTSLRLCRMPGAAEPDRTAAQDLADIARRFGIDPATLARVVNDGR